jgi:hypothetical protein
VIRVVTSLLKPAAGTMEVFGVPHRQRRGRVEGALPITAASLLLGRLAR